MMQLERIACAKVLGLEGEMESWPVWLGQRE